MNHFRKLTLAAAAALLFVAGAHAQAIDPVSGGMKVAGSVVSGNADDGSPGLKGAAVVNTTLPTYTNGQRGDLQMGVRGGLDVNLCDAGGAACQKVTNPSDALSNTTNSAGAIDLPETFNGSTWDRLRSAQGAASNGNNGLGVMATEEAGRTWNHVSTNATTTVKSGKGFLHAIVVGTPGASETITCYDNTTATGSIITVVSPAAPGALIADIGFTTGLTCVTAGTTAGDYTFVYR